MDDLRQAVLDLVRLGAAGDTESVRMYGRRLLRRLQDPNDSSFRQQLQTLLASGSRTRTLRGVTLRESPAMVIDGHVSLQLLKLDQNPHLPEPVLDRPTHDEIAKLINERSKAANFMEAGLEPTKSILLIGPPGVGKTMTAGFIATRLGLPLITVDLAAVVSSYLGKTGQNLRQALDYARSSPCVLLLDEFDALAKRRDDPADVGELKRIVNVLLLELESWPSESLLIAATNHPELLDRAVWRRFDRVVELGLPSLKGRVGILKRVFQDAGMVPHDDLIRLTAILLPNRSGSDLARFAKAVMRDAILLGSESSLDEALTTALRKLLKDGEISADARDSVIRLASSALGMPHRRIAELLGVSHVTIGRILRRQTGLRRSSDDSGANSDQVTLRSRDEDVSQQ